MEEFTTDELLEWVDTQFDYELKDGEVTAKLYGERYNIAPNTAGARLNILVRKGLLTSFRAVVDGKKVRVFRKVPRVEYEASANGAKEQE